MQKMKLTNDGSGTVAQVFFISDNFLQFFT